jgi:DNA-binding IclR family transcriptional regulator
MVANFFSIDFQTLEATERSVLEELAREGSLGRRELSQAVSRSEDALEPSLFGLTQMGYVTSDGGRYRLGNWFFERWLKRVVGARTSEARPA